jgi:hypothetical protein
MAAQVFEEIIVTLFVSLHVTIISCACMLAWRCQKLLCVVLIIILIIYLHSSLKFS